MDIRIFTVHTITETTPPGSSSVFAPAIIVDVVVEAYDTDPALWSMEIRRTVRVHVLRPVRYTVQVLAAGGTGLD